MIISLHLPKTAGTSFSRSLEECFGNKLLKDYKDLPINKSQSKRKSQAVIKSIFNMIKRPVAKECIHGHFMPLKYRFCKGY